MGKALMKFSTFVVALLLIILVADIPSSKVVQAQVQKCHHAKDWWTKEFSTENYISLYKIEKVNI
ncbi:hypothetical protein RDI58_021568 [Solanum bulbocastanum]|uniref:Uncharacterized protein n=1 Tax=Solanum bulbocastanum TaxID=147425 RepID=A0AAN8T170_SOLBU